MLTPMLSGLCECPLKSVLIKAHCYPIAVLQANNKLWSIPRLSGLNRVRTEEYVEVSGIDYHVAAVRK